LRQQNVTDASGPEGEVYPFKQLFYHFLVILSTLNAPRAISAPSEVIYVRNHRMQ